MEASCKPANRDGLRSRILGNVVKIIIKAVTMPCRVYTIRACEISGRISDGKTNSVDVAFFIVDEFLRRRLMGNCVLNITRSANVNSVLNIRRLRLHPVLIIPYQAEAKGILGT